MQLSFDEVKPFIENLEKEAKAIKEELMRLCWFMRGSVSYSDAMNLSNAERNIINKLIKDNMETTKKSGLPFF